MGMRPALDPYASPPSLIDRELGGEAYKKIRSVAENLALIGVVAENIDAVAEASTIVDDLLLAVAAVADVDAAVVATAADVISAELAKDVAENKALESSGSAGEASVSAGLAAASATVSTTKAAEANTSRLAADAAAGVSTNQSTIATTKAAEALASSTSAATSEGLAVAAKNLAISAQIAAETAAAAAMAAYDNFDDRYLGPKAANPVADNDGAPLQAGMLYFNTVSEVMRLYTGSLWAAAYVTGTGFAEAIHDHTIADVTGLQGALDNKESAVALGNASQYYRGDKSWQTLNKGAVGLGSVDNTSDANKPVSTAQATAIGLKLDATHAGAGGAAHANAVASGAAGFMTGADKSKLDAVAAGATANSTDAQLKDRANHTGTQAIASIAASATARIFGRNAAGAGAGEELTATQVTALLNAFTSTLKGLVPASGGGTTNFLRADGTWASPASSGWMQVGSTLSLSGTATASFISIPQTYNELYLELVGLSTVSDATLRLAMSGDSATYNGDEVITNSLLAAFSYSGGIHFPNYRREGGLLVPTVNALASSPAMHTSNACVSASMPWRVTQGINALKLSPSTGNWDAGTIKLWGK
jgi:hypothetical protein